MWPGGLEQEKGTIDSSMSTFFVSKWLPGWNHLRTTDTVISMGYERKVGKESIIQEKVVNQPRKHIIHKALKWKKLLNDGKVKSF